MKNIKIHLLNFLSEKKYNYYKEIEFVCHIKVDLYNEINDKQVDELIRNIYK